MFKTTGYFMYNLVLALWVGGMAIFTFLVTPAVFKSFDRDMASLIVGKFFNGYFYYNLTLSLAALILLLATWTDKSKGGFKASLLLIVAAVLITSFVALKLYPAIKEVKKQVPSFVTTPADSEARRKFTRMHTLSFALNLALLTDGAALLFISATRLKE